MSRRRNQIVLAAVVVVAAASFLIRWQACGGGGGGGSPKPTAGGDVASAGGTRGTRIDPATVARGSIAGRVLDPAGAPVGAARVCGYAYSDELPEDETRDPLCATTGADGGYRLSDLLPARYELHGHAPRFAPGQYRTEGEDGRDERGLRLAAGESRSGVDITLGGSGVEVTGIVKDIGGGPVAGAWVYLRHGRGWYGGGATATVQSEADGTFRAWTAPGRLRATAQADGYADGEKEAVAPGQTIEVLLTPESVLAGRVVEKQGGAPVPGAKVQIGGSWMDDGGGSWQSATTDEEGRFRITRLSPGRYKPTAIAPGRYGQAAESVLLGLGQVVEDLVIEVHPATQVIGKVVLPDGKTPCPEGWVTLSDEVARLNEGGSIEEDGKVEFDALLPGTYQVEIRCTGYRAADEYDAVVVAAGTSPPEQVWKVADGARLRGTVLAHDGTPVGGASVNAQPAIADDGWKSWQWEETEADGTFEMDGLRGGTYKVSASPDDAPETEKPISVEVPDQGEASVEIRLAQGGTIAGTVRDEDGQPVARVHVRAQGRRGGFRWGGNDGTQTLDDGSFRLEGVAPGSYRVTAARDSWGWGSELRAPGKTDDDKAGEKVEVKAGQTARADLLVESLSGVIRGKVVDGSGAAVTDAFVDAERESDSAAAEAGGTRRSMRWGWSRTPILTDTDGAFAIEKLSPGTYTVRAYRKGGGEALVEHVAVGTTVTVTIRPTGSIAGDVTVSGGGSPDQVTITVLDEKTGFRRREEFFRTEGAFVMRELPAGTYEISASSSAGTGKAEAVLSDGQELRGVAVTLAARGGVTGRLITADTGVPLPGYLVEVTPFGSSEFGFEGGSMPPTTDADGKFEIKSAPTGKVQLMAFAFGQQDAEYAFARKVVTLEGGKTLDVGDIKVPKLRNKMSEDPGDLGFELEQKMPTDDPEKDKLIVKIVRPDGPAAKAGMKVGDEIVSIDGQDVRSDPYQFWQLAFVAPGTTLSFGLERGATVTITAGPPRS